MTNASREFSIASRADLRGGAHLITKPNRSWLERWSTGSGAIVDVWVEGVQGVWTGEGGSACLRAIMISAALQGLAANMTFADGGNLVCVTTMFEADMRARGHKPKLGHMTALAKLSLGDEVFESTSDDSAPHAMVAALESFLSDPFSPVHGVSRCPSGRYKKSCPADLGIMNNRLERAVAMSADFLREAHEDLRFAAILASDTDQPRRAQSLSRAASKAKELGGELIGAWVAARRSEPKATKLVGATLERGADGRRISYMVNSIETSFEARATVARGGEQVTKLRGTTSLQMPAATPPEVVDVLFSIATPLDLASDTVWPIESLPREVRELASDAGHNDETARATVSIHDVCRVLGIDAMVHEPVDGEDVTRPATHSEFFAKLGGIREAMLVSIEAPWRAAKTIAGRLELAEDGLVSKLAERLCEVDPDWLAALVKESS